MKHLTFHSRSWQTQVKNDLMNLTYCLPWVQSRAKYEIPVPWPASIVFLAYRVLCYLVQIETVNLHQQENVHNWNYKTFSIHLQGLKGVEGEAFWVFFFNRAFFYIYWFIYCFIPVIWRELPEKKWFSIYDLKPDRRVEKFNSKSSLFPED